VPLNLHRPWLRVVCAAAIVLALLASDASAAVSTPEQRCARAKLLAAAGEARDRFACVRRDLSSGSYPGCFAAAARRRAAAFARAEARGGCATTGDSDAIGQEVDLRAAIGILQIVPVGPRTSRCAALQLAAAGVATAGLVRVQALDPRLASPVRLASNLARVRERLAGDLERARGRGDCLTPAGDFQLVGIPELIATSLRDLLCPGCGVECPCWSPQSVDAAFPPGFFDAAGRGGAVCDVDDVPSLVTTESCTYPGPAELYLPRAGAVLLRLGTCVPIFTDLAFEGGALCGGVPTIESLTPAETAACGAALEASATYRRECR
jgi:hypothetical protein